MTVSTYRGTRVTVVHDRQSLETSTPEGQFGRVAAPGEEYVRQCIAAGICPWCGSGPYKVLALHVVGRHGIGRKELRQHAGLGRADSICDPQHSEHFRELRRVDGITPPMAPTPLPRPCVICGTDIPYAHSTQNTKTCGPECSKIHRSNRLTGITKTVTPAVRRGQSARARRVTPEMHRRASAAVSPEARMRASVAAGEVAHKKAAHRPVFHGVARSADHGCRCQDCRAYRQWAKGRSPDKPTPVAGSLPCHEACMKCAEYIEILGTLSTEHDQT